MTSPTKPHAKLPIKSSTLRILFYTAIILFSIFAALFVLANSMIRTCDDGNKTQIAQLQACKLSREVEFYKTKYGAYPTTEDGLQSLLTKRLIKKIPTDPWGIQYQYQIFGKNAKKPFAVYSLGADRKKGGSDFGKDLFCKEEEPGFWSRISGCAGSRY